MRRPRFRLRTLVIAVAVLGILLGGVIALERHRQRVRYGALIRRIAAEEQYRRELVEALTRRIPEDPDHFGRWSAHYSREADRYARQKRRLQREMERMPWDPVPQEDPDGS